MIAERQRAQILVALIMLSTVLLLSLPTVKAETYVVVYDQEDNIVTSKVEFVGARLYNETHAIVEDPSFVAIAYKGVELYHLEGLKDNTTYAVKVPLGRLVLEIPKGLYYKVTHVRTGLVFEGVSEGKPIDCGLLPYGLVEVYVKGARELMEVTNWQGGLVRVKEEIGLEPKALHLLLPSLVPVITPVIFALCYVYRRHKLLASIRAPSPKINLHNSHHMSNLRLRPVTKAVVKPLDVNVMKREEDDKVMKVLEVLSKPPTSIADLIERDERWLERELEKVENSPRLNIRLALARFRRKIRSQAEKVKKLRHVLASLIHKIASDEVEIVIYWHHPMTKKRRSRKKMVKEFREFLALFTNALRAISSSARRGARNSTGSLRAHDS